MKSSEETELDKTLHMRLHDFGTNTKAKNGLCRFISTDRVARPKNHCFY